MIQYSFSIHNQEGDSLIVNQKLYYGNSSTLLKKLKYYPLALLLLIIFLFGAVSVFFL